MSDAYVPESRWRTAAAAALVGGGLLLAGWAVVRGMSGGGAGGAEVGADVSRLAFRDVDGNRRTLADYRGKVVLVDVWATWCPPCRRSLPEVADLQKAAGGGYVVLPISVDEGGWSAVKPFLAQNPQLGLTAYLPDGKAGLAPLGEIRGIPASFVVDRRGRLVRTWAGYGEGMAKRAVDEALKLR
ncbi:TlpA disulfide reductase family protein [Geothrix sp. 21YS21S-4]|uniref:TlpA disulfide reductase family protein n=1 Tax=Geothrix sp. 21YS21S-4 TaxID=3068889 RepID=UPI0027BA56B9|nr:TlpA disulfide reductase family protein [Geothrix sp. 21YS21S-4]